MGVELVPTEWVDRLADSPEPAARWVAFTGLLGLGPTDPRVAEAQRAVLDDPRTEDLLARLGDWEVERRVSGHDRPEFTPNLITLLLDMGVRPEDDARLAQVVAQLPDHQHDGRFQSLGRHQGGDPVWASLPCDHHLILEVLIRCGYGNDPRVLTGLERLASDLTATAQGTAWKCLPDPVVRFRGPGRVGDCCPQVSLEALRVYSLLEPSARPPELADAVRTALAVWSNRASEHPYMFGHGRAFKEGKYPLVWYSAQAVVEAVGRYPEVWSGPVARPENTRSLAELAAVLRAYALGSVGVVTPQSVFKGFEAQSYGRRGIPSDLASALAIRALARTQPIAAQVLAVDVASLGSAKGGTGLPLPPR